MSFISVSLCSLSHGELSVVASFSDGEASGRSNIESDVVMRCLVTSSEPMGITFKLRWQVDHNWNKQSYNEEKKSCLDI